MTSLSQKLKSLGVQVGADDIRPAKPNNLFNIENIAGAVSTHNHFGDTFVRISDYNYDYTHGNCGIQINAPLDGVALWANDERISSLQSPSIAFLDIETTGLAGGTGTYAFLIGVGKYSDKNFQIAQFFMQDPISEQAQLAEVEEFIAPCDAIVTFNGKSFDIPLLRSRFIAQGWHSPFENLSHIDLLHLSRKLWRARIPIRRARYYDPAAS